MEEIKSILSEMQTIQLEEMQEVQLQNRMDTKFVFHRKLLTEILDKLKTHYSVFKIENQLISGYESIYFDTKNLQFYLDHHNRKNHRVKVRKRRYQSNGHTFFELKEKRADRTVKKRIPTKDFSESITTEEQAFLDDFWRPGLVLEPTLKNHYYRITLVDIAKTERITLDLQINFIVGKEEVCLDYLVVAELKQDRINRSSLFFQLMRNMGIAPYRISKYCIGTVILEKENNIKYNRFKRKLLKLKKIEDDFK